MDEYGECSNLFNVEIMLEDTEGNEYRASQEGVIIKAQGDILHKVRRLKGIKEFTFKNIFKKQY